MAGRKQWLTPKSDSLESFVFFVLRVVVVLALIGAAVFLALTDRLPAASGLVLLSIGAAILRRDVP
jgi:hypothetical protein